MPKMSSGSASRCDSAPERLDDHIFFGMNLDEQQTAFRDAIWDESKRIVFSNSRSGTGKTTIAVATALLLCQYHRYDSVVYVMHSVGDAQGFLPGTISEKSSVWFEGLYQAIYAANEMPDKIISTESMAGRKDGTAYVTAITDSYLRGSNIGANERTVLIVDEAQNYDEHSLRKVLTRANEGTKVIVIGHDGQIDLKYKGDSAFVRCMEHFSAKNDSRVAFCPLAKNYRGFISSVADEPWQEVEHKREENRAGICVWKPVDPAIIEV